MKKPNLTEGEWIFVNKTNDICVGIKNYHPIVRLSPRIAGIWPTGFKEERVANAKAIAQVPNMIDDIMCMYYHFLGQWESVKDHPSSNYGRDAFSLYETLVNAGCEPEKEETERFRKAGYVE